MRPYSLPNIVGSGLRGVLIHFCQIRIEFSVPPCLCVSVVSSYCAKPSAWVTAPIATVWSI